MDDLLDKLAETGLFTKADPVRHATTAYSQEPEWIEKPKKKVSGKDLRK